MNWGAFIAVGTGAAFGAWLRWGLGLWLNAAWPQVPLGTLVANVAGGYMIGLALAWFAASEGVSPEARLLIVTGFLGGLTTFSTFSAELVTLLQQGRGLWAVALAMVHLAGSVAMTFAGIGTVAWLKG